MPFDPVPRSPTAALLREARAVIATPEHWCKGACARSPDGSPVIAFGHGATMWCAIGALQHAIGRRGMSLMGGTCLPYEKVCIALESVAPLEVAAWNDMPDRSHADVLKLFDQAIERAERLEVAYAV